MADEKTSKRVAKKAGGALKKGSAKKKDLKSIAGSALTQAPNKPRKKK